MSMLTTFEAIKKTLTRKSHAYEAARSRHRALTTYSTPEALLAGVRPGSALSATERDRVIVALVEENQLAPQQVWQSLLLVAFEPMLVQLRGTLGWRDDEDSDQDLLLAFLEALQTVRAGAYVSLGLRWATQARLSASRQPAREEAELDDELHEGAPLGASPDVKLEVSEALEMLEARAGRDVVDAIIATEIGGETLLEYVARRHASELSGERARIYERLSHACSEALDDVRVQYTRHFRRAA